MIAMLRVMHTTDYLSLLYTARGSKLPRVEKRECCVKLKMKFEERRLERMQVFV